MATTISSLPPPIQQKFNAKLLSTPQAHLIHGMCATPYTMTDGDGITLRLRRYQRLETAPVPLGPAMNNPPVQQLTAVDIDATIDWYATYIVLTKQVTISNQDKPLNEAALKLGISMRETEDQLIRDMLEGTAGLVNCTNGVNADNPTEITAADVETVVAALVGADGEFISNMIEAQDKFGTGPVADSFFAMCHSDMINQLSACNGYIGKAQYPNNKNVSPAEWGNIGNVRFFQSSRGSMTTGASMLGNDVYNIFITAQEAYAKNEQNSVSAKFIYHPPGHGDDPAELRQTAAWRMAQVPQITNDAWIINLRATLA